MTVINRSALVPYSAEKMFILVDDIAAYPEFLPWCRSTTIISRELAIVEASIQIAKSGLNKTFTTRNTIKDTELIEIQLVDGPFKELHGYWQFNALHENACKVSLDIEFEFSSKLLSMSLGPIFSQICNTLVNSFVKRAQDIYER